MSNNTLQQNRLYAEESEQVENNKRRTLFTIKVGAITQLVRDMLTVILLWKLIGML